MQVKLLLPSHNNNPSYKADAIPTLKLTAHFGAFVCIAPNRLINLRCLCLVDMTSNIRSLSSPSHPISFEFGEEPTQATVTLTDDAQASAPKDFVVLTKLAKPHE